MGEGVYGSGGAARDGFEGKRVWVREESWDWVVREEIIGEMKILFFILLFINLYEFPHGELVGVLNSLQEE